MPAPRPGLVLATLSAALATRVLGLSLVVPAFPAHGEALGATLALTGLAFAAYGASMAIFQIPFGMLSDRWGRRGAILLGLAVSAVGSVLCAFAPDVWTLTAARALAGAGAVSGVAFALLGEVFDERRRTMAMAVAGISVGAAFPLGVLAGSFLAPRAGGAPALFLATGGLTALAFLLALALPRGRPAAREDPRATLRALASGEHWRLNVNGFALNFFRDAVIFTAPLVVLRFASESEQWLYLGPAVLLGGLALGATARLSDRGRLREVLFASTVLLGVGAVLVLHARAGLAFLAAGAAFFAAHASLSAALPSLAARLSGEARRGATQSALQVSQYAGLAAGGVAAGALYAWPVLFDGVLILVASAGVLALRGLRIPPSGDPNRVHADTAETSR